MIDERIKTMKLKESTHDKLIDIKKKTRLRIFDRVVDYIIENQKTLEEIEEHQELTENLKQLRIKNEALVFAMRELIQFMKQNGMMSFPEDRIENMPLEMKIAFQDTGINLIPFDIDLNILSEETKEGNK